MTEHEPKFADQFRGDPPDRPAVPPDRSSVDLTIHPTSPKPMREPRHDVDGPSDSGDPSVPAPQPNPSTGPVPVEDIYRCFDRGHDVGLRHEDGSLYSGTCHDCGTRYERGPVVSSAHVDLDEIEADFAEDGKRFVFVDDLGAALEIPGYDAALDGAE